MNCKPLRRGRGCVAALAALVLTACGQVPPPAAEPLAVRVRTLDAGGPAALTIYTGEIRSRFETEIAFQVGGRLVERAVELGAAVKRGQLLARLDDVDLRLAAAAAREQLAAAEADAGLAQAEFERARTLVAQNFVSASALDTRQTALDAAQARLRQARAQTALAARQTGYAGLHAEHAAVVTAVLADRGEVVEAGKAVLRLAREDARELLIHVPESRIEAIRPGMPAQVRPLANPARSYAAEVREIAAAADFRTRSFAVRLSLTQADQHLPLGSSAVAGFASAAGAGTLLPLPAVGQFRGRSVVWAVDAQGEVQPREVELLALREDGALIGSGLEPGLQVVLAGTHRLSPGQIVRVLAEDAPVALDARR